MDPSGQRHLSQGTSPKSKLDMVACDDVWRHDSMKRGRGQNDELCKPDSGTESKVHGTCALGKSPKPGLGTCQKKLLLHHGHGKYE